MNVMEATDFFEGHPAARELFDGVLLAIDKVGPFTTRVSRSQIAFKRKRTFAAVWIPGQYLRGETAPLVLTVFTRKRIRSQRWKQVAEPAPGRFTHHLEVFSSTDIDASVEGWLQRAWDAAGG